MTIKHFISLIIPKIKEFFWKSREIVKQWRRLVSVLELRKTRVFLEDKKLEYERRNTEESLKFAFAVGKQIEIIDLLLKGKNVV